MGQVTPVPTTRSFVVAATPTMTDQTNGLFPWRSMNGWK
jgi:hypothetical protein